MKTRTTVTKQDVDAAIAYEHYFTAAEGVAGALAVIDETRKRHGLPPMPVLPPMRSAPSLARVTICVLVLRNGFTVSGTNACVSDALFDAEKGRAFARQKAYDQVWHLLGYELRSEIAATAVVELPMGHPPGPPADQGLTDWRDGMMRIIAHAYSGSLDPERREPPGAGPHRRGYEQPGKRSGDPPSMDGTTTVDGQAWKPSDGYIDPI